MDERNFHWPRHCFITIVCAHIVYTYTHGPRHYFITIGNKQGFKSKADYITPLYMSQPGRHTYTWTHKCWNGTSHSFVFRAHGHLRCMDWSHSHKHALQWWMHLRVDVWGFFFILIEIFSQLYTGCDFTVFISTDAFNGNSETCTKIMNTSCIHLPRQLSCVFGTCLVISLNMYPFIYSVK